MEVRRGGLTRFLDVLRSVSACWISADTLDRLPEATRCGSTRVAGIDLNRERMRAVLSGVLALAADPRGFRADSLARQVHERLGRKSTSRQASYDLRNLRGKDLVRKLDGPRSYLCPLAAVRTLMAISLVREKILQPLLAGLTSSCQPNPVTSPLDQHSANLRSELQRLMNTLGIAA